MEKAKEAGATKRRRWDSRTKIKIVLERLSGRPYQRYATSARSMLKV